MREIESVETGQRVLGELFANAARAVIFSGAGISTESGIPDFRSPGGVWSKTVPITFDEFLQSESARMEDWRRRFDMHRRFLAAEPNAAHRATARLMANGLVGAVITQNVDGLHQKGGAPADRVIELHGNGNHAACIDCGETRSIASVEEEIRVEGRTPRCHRCNGLVKAAVISFGQQMPLEPMLRAEQETKAADLFVAVGSSLVVYPAAGFPLMAKENGSTLAIVNREPTEQDVVADVVLRGPIAALFEKLAEV